MILKQITFREREVGKDKIGEVMGYILTHFHDVKFLENREIAQSQQKIQSSCNANP